MTPGQARRALQTWTEISDSRNGLVQAALAAGVEKMEIHRITGIARTTIDRIEGQAPAPVYGEAAYAHLSDAELAARVIAVNYPLHPDPLQRELARRFPDIEGLRDAAVTLMRRHHAKVYPSGRPPLPDWPGEAAPGQAELNEAYREAISEIAGKTTSD